MFNLLENDGFNGYNVGVSNFILSIMGNISDYYIKFKQ